MSKDNLQKVRKINHLCSQELGFDEGKILFEKLKKILIFIIKVKYFQRLFQILIMF
jgi:hypothetical protein